MGSTRPKMPGVTEIFSEYVRRRKRGHGQQETLQFLKPVLDRLNSQARQQLAALLRSWEAREGAKYKTRQHKDAFYEEHEVVMAPSPDEDLSWLPAAPAQGQPTPHMPPALNVNAPVHPSVEQAQGPSGLPNDEVHYCPSCGRANREGDIFCFACGTNLSVNGGQTQSLEREEADLMQVGKTHFGRSSQLLLHVQGTDRPIYVNVHEKTELILGRHSASSDTRPDVDLGPYRAGEHGVSRAHARLRYQDNTIMITDLGSVNHTYINGQRLHAHEVRVLQDGDEIRLGRLALRVTFQHSVRRLR